jgi:hypothetical protein
MYEPHEQLKTAIEAQHGGRAAFVQSLPVKETFRDYPAFEGTIHIFHLAGSPTGATTVYAWSSPMEGSRTRRIRTVLKEGAITGPIQAVRAMLMAEHNAGN